MATPWTLSELKKQCDIMIEGRQSLDKWLDHNLMSGVAQKQYAYLESKAKRMVANWVYPDPPRDLD